MASLPPLMVTALSVELGSISLATWIEAPVTSLISLILDPPFPMSDPHCEAGTIKRNVIGGLVVVFGATKLARSCSEEERENFSLYLIGTFSISKVVWPVPRLFYWIINR